MISSTSSTDRTPHCGVIAPTGKAPARPKPALADEVSTENAAFLRSALQRQPEIRPEVVERARALVADPNYPPREVLQNIALQILQAPDLSEDQS
jgi:hypothetical protein